MKSNFNKYQIWRNFSDLIILTSTKNVTKITSQIASLHDQNKSTFFGGPAFIQPIRTICKKPALQKSHFCFDHVNRLKICQFYNPIFGCDASSGFPSQMPCLTYTSNNYMQFTHTCAGRRTAASEYRFRNLLLHLPMHYRYTNFECCDTRHW